MNPTTIRIIEDSVTQARLCRRRTLFETLLSKAGCEIELFRTVSESDTDKVIEEMRQPTSIKSFALQTDPYQYADEKEYTCFTVRYQNVEGIGMIPSMTIVKTVATKKECVARTITTEYHIRASADSIAKNSRTIGVLLEDLRYFNRMMTKILTRELRNDMVFITQRTLGKNGCSRIEPYDYTRLTETPVRSFREDMAVIHKWEHTPAGWTVAEICTGSGSQSEQSTFDFMIGVKNTLPEAAVFYIRKKLDGEIPIGRICRVDYDPKKLFYATDTVTGKRFFIFRNCLENPEVWDILDEPTS